MPAAPGVWLPAERVALPLEPAVPVVVRVAIPAVRAVPVAAHVAAIVAAMLAATVVAMRVALEAVVMLAASAAAAAMAAAGIGKQLHLTSDRQARLLRQASLSDRICRCEMNPFAMPANRPPST